MITLSLFISAVVFILAYRYYGAFLARRFELNDQTPTPSHAEYDGIDRVPARRAVLMGHHFSSIAGAGPIVGPIIAALAFGWLPALLWVLAGSVLVGGTHDFAALVASIRHKARSIAEVARLHMSPLAYRLFLLFIWLTLMYLLVAFADLTTHTFVENGAVAASAVFFIILAIGFGFSVYRCQMPILKASVIFVPLVFFGVWLGQESPLTLETAAAWCGLSPGAAWDILLIAYCFIASTTPVWALLQPRDYLSSFLLYASLLGGFAGILLGGFALQYSWHRAWAAPELGALVPILFITVACGACSGFHALVASGTSSKQLDRESDARFVGYGAMLIEGLVAVVAIATVMILLPGSPLTKAAPLAVYASGLGQFLAVLGIPLAIGEAFALLALSTFILTSLDTGTRLARYVFEELFSLRPGRSRYFSTAATLVLPVILLSITLHDSSGQPIPAWKAIWPAFGATNQLMAGLTLLVITVWLRKNGKASAFVFWPMCFMVVMTVWSLVLLIANQGFSLLGGIALLLLILALVLIWEAYRVLRDSNNLIPANTGARC